MDSKPDNFDANKEPKSIDQVMAENNLNQINSILSFIFSPATLSPAPFTTSISKTPYNEKTNEDRFN